VDGLVNDSAVSSPKVKFLSLASSMGMGNLERIVLLGPIK
jgi:hypothetical protein